MKQTFFRENAVYNSLASFGQKYTAGREEKRYTVFSVLSDGTKLMGLLILKNFISMIKILLCSC
jgi:hypothetical protein